MITHTTPADVDALKALYRAAFPTEDLVPLIKRLFAEVEGLLSLAARADDGTPIGHILFTPGTVAGAAVDLLGPLAIHPAHQRRGLGQALIKAGFAALADSASCLVLVLGDPAYYSRSGFRPTTLVVPPYRLPQGWETAWQGFALKPAGAHLTGPLNLPDPWLQPALWAEG